MGGDDPVCRGVRRDRAAVRGAGVVAGSDPAAELAETSAKFGTLLRALGAEGVA